MTGNRGFGIRGDENQVKPFLFCDSKSLCSLNDTELFTVLADDS